MSDKEFFQNLDWVIADCDDNETADEAEMDARARYEDAISDWQLSQYERAEFAEYA